jgi:phage tail sheath protein FI
MAKFSVSPGVTLSEVDNTFLMGQPVQAGAAIIGPAVKGPVEIPTLVTSYSDYVNRFGDILVSGSDTYSYLTSISAYNYFNNGGTSLIVARVVSGSYTSATSSKVSNGLNTSTGATASATINMSTQFIGANATGSWIGTRISVLGNDYYVVPNSSGFNTYSNLADYMYTSSGATTNDNYDNYAAALVSGINDPNFELSTYLVASYSTPTLTISAKTAGTSFNGTTIYKEAPFGQPGTAVTPTLSGGTDSVSADAFVLETLSEGVIMNSTSTENSDGTLPSGSKDNVRWEITNANTGSGTFNLIIRQGDDKTSSKTVLESWNDLTLDPNSTRFISKVIGDQTLVYSSTTNQIDISSGTYPNQSRYVRVKSVNYLTPNYINSSGQPTTAYTASIPTNGSGSFGSATGDVKAGANFYENIGTQTQGLVAGNYTNMVNLLANNNDYQFNVLSTPGLTDESHTSTISTIVTNTQNRGDNLYVVDLVNYSGGVTDAVTQAQTLDTSYAAAYWPWVRITDPATGKQVAVPASTLIPGVYAFNDKVSAPWFAPAGINRGGLSTVLRAQYKLSQADKDTLYANNINPLATLPKKGVVVFGQKTLQKSASALDRVNVRRLLIDLKGYIKQVADTIVFEQNTITTRNSFLSRVNPYLQTIQQKQGLYAFKVIMDDSNNGPDVIDRNQLIGQIYIQPTRTAEFIALDFILQPTGASFPA